MRMDVHLFRCMHSACDGPIFACMCLVTPFHVFRLSAGLPLPRVRDLCCAYTIAYTTITTLFVSSTLISFGSSLFPPFFMHSVSWYSAPVLCVYCTVLLGHLAPPIINLSSHSCLFCPITFQRTFLLTSQEEAPHSRQARCAAQKNCAGARAYSIPGG